MNKVGTFGKYLPLERHTLIKLFTVYFNLLVTAGRRLDP